MKKRLGSSSRSFVSGENVSNFCWILKHQFIYYYTLNLVSWYCCELFHPVIFGAVSSGAIPVAWRCNQNVPDSRLVVLKTDFASRNHFLRVSMGALNGQSVFLKHSLLYTYTCAQAVYINGNKRDQSQECPWGAGLAPPRSWPWFCLLIKGKRRPTKTLKIQLTERYNIESSAPLSKLM